MGFTKVLGDVYELLGKYYRTVVDFRNPEYTPTEKARHFLLALASVPFNVAGVPIAVYSLNYAKQIALSRRLKARFEKKGTARRLSEAARGGARSGRRPASSRYFVAT